MKRLIDWMVGSQNWGSVGLSRSLAWSSHREINATSTWDSVLPPSLSYVALRPANACSIGELSVRDRRSWFTTSSRRRDRGIKPKAVNRGHQTDGRRSY